MTAPDDADRGPGAPGRGRRGPTAATPATARHRSPPPSTAPSDRPRRGRRHATRAADRGATARTHRAGTGRDAAGRATPAARGHRAGPRRRRSAASRTHDAVTGPDRPRRRGRRRRPVSPPPPPPPRHRPVGRRLAGELHRRPRTAAPRRPRSPERRPCRGRRPTGGRCSPFRPLPEPARRSQLRRPHRPLRPPGAARASRTRCRCLGRPRSPAHRRCVAAGLPTGRPASAGDPTAAPLHAVAAAGAAVTTAALPASTAGQPSPSDAGRRRIRPGRVLTDGSAGGRAVTSAGRGDRRTADRAAVRRRGGTGRRPTRRHVPDGDPTAGLTPATRPPPTSTAPSRRRPPTDGRPGTAPAAPVAAQLARQIAVLRHAPDGAHTMTLVLTPDDLGPVTVQVTVSKGTLDLTLRGAHEHGRRGTPRRAARPAPRPRVRRADLSARGSTSTADTGGVRGPCRAASSRPPPAAAARPAAGAAGWPDGRVPSVVADCR